MPENRKYVVSSCIMIFLVREHSTGKKELVGYIIDAVTHSGRSLKRLNEYSTCILYMQN